MNALYRFDEDGWYQGFIVIDRPMEQYDARMGVDLTPDQPPDPPRGYRARRQNGGWVLFEVTTTEGTP